MSQIASSWETGTLEKSVALLESMLRKGFVDPDAATRKHMRRWGGGRVRVGGREGGLVRVGGMEKQRLMEAVRRVEGVCVCVGKMKLSAIWL